MSWTLDNTVYTYIIDKHVHTNTFTELPTKNETYIYSLQDHP